MTGNAQSAASLHTKVKLKDAHTHLLSVKLATIHPATKVVRFITFGLAGASQTLSASEQSERNYSQLLTGIMERKS